MDVASLLTASVGHRRRRSERPATTGADDFGEPDDDSSSFRSPPEQPLLQVWHLLLAIASIMAILLGAHYAFIMSAVKSEIQSHELRDAERAVPLSTGAVERERRINLLERADQQSIAERLQLRADIERIEKDLTVIRERQEQVRAKLGMRNGTP